MSRSPRLLFSSIEQILDHAPGPFISSPLQKIWGIKNVSKFGARFCNFSSRFLGGGRDSLILNSRTRKKQLEQKNKKMTSMVEPGPEWPPNDCSLIDKGGEDCESWACFWFPCCPRCYSLMGNRRGIFCVAKCCGAPNA